MTEQSDKIKAQLAPLKDKGFFVFHDAYSYFNDAYGLNQTGYFTINPLVAPGAKTIAHIKEEIEEHIKTVLGADRVVWLDHGNLIGDDTDGHIDTIVRFAPDDTLLYIAPTRPDDEQHADFAALETQLRSLRTADGQPYRLLPLPMNDPIMDEDGERLPATYANFLVINGAVIVPTYNQPDLDSRALATIAEAFKGYDIIGIDARTIIKQHGSIHCLTMQGV